MKFSTIQLARMDGVTTQTIRHRIAAGIYGEVDRTAGGHYRITVRQQRTVGYARVSSRKQISSIDTQQGFIRDRHPGCELIADVASSFNFKRKGLRTLLGAAMRGDSIRLVVASQDRLSRAGFELIRWIIELSGGRVKILDEAPGAAQSAFDTTTLISFITSFCNAYYGRRSHERRRRRGNQKDTLFPAKT